MANEVHEMLLAKGWYLFSAGGAVFLLPYLYPFISSRGFSDPQIGLLAAVRPWLAAVAALTGPALADRFNCHRAMMVTTFAASILLRASILYAAEAQYLLLFTVVIASEYLAAPPGVLADAAVVALCSRQQGASYGRQRLWGSIGWGGLSFGAGVLLDSCGYGAGFLVYLILSAPCIYILARFSYGGSSSSSSSSSSSAGGNGAGGSSQGGKAASAHGNKEEAEGGGDHSEAQLSVWPGLAGGALHEEALLPHAHEPFPFIRALVRTISGVPPAPSPPGSQARCRRPVSPKPQATCCGQGDSNGAYQHPAGLMATPLPLPPPELMHLSTPFGYEAAQHPRGASVAVSIAAAEAAAEEGGTPADASDGSGHGGGQRYSMMKLSSSVENWIQRSETWIRQREREREAAVAAAVSVATAATAAAASSDGGAVAPEGAARAGAFLGSPAVSGSCATAGLSGAGGAGGADACAGGAGAATGYEYCEEQDLLLGPMSVQRAAKGSASGVHLVANIRGRTGSGASPTASYHIHVSASAAAAAATQLSTQCKNCDCNCDGLAAAAGGKLQLGSSTTLESIALGSAAATNPATPVCSDKQQHRGVRGARSPHQKTTASGSSDGGSGFLRRAGRLLSDGAVWLFLAKVFLLGFGTGTIGTWLFIYVSSLGASHALQGLMLTMNCVAEVPVFFFQEHVTRRFPAGAILHVATGSLVLRLAAYAALPSLPSPWFVLPVELMQGLTFALSWGTCCVHCKHIAPESLQATMQGLWQAMFNGLASGAGGLVGAVLHDRLGGRAMFAITAGLIFVGWVLLAAAEGLVALVAAQRRRRAGSGPSDECVHLMREEEDSGRRGGSGGSGGRGGHSARQQQCEVVVAAAAVLEGEQRALLAAGGGAANAPQLPSAALGRAAGSGRGQTARALGKAAGASVSYVLRLALAGAWRHGFHTAASAAAAAAASATGGAHINAGPTGPSSSSSNTAPIAAGPPSYDDVADDMSHGGLLYSFFVRRRTGSLGGLSVLSSGGAGSGAISPKQSLLSQRREGRGETSTGGSGGGGGGGDGSRRGMHTRGGSAVALTPDDEALPSGAYGAGGGGLERASSDVAFDGGRDQGGQDNRNGAAHRSAAPAAGAYSTGESGSSGSGSSGSSGGSSMLDALGLAAAAASPPVLPASPATAWL